MISDPKGVIVLNIFNHNLKKVQNNHDSEGF